MFGADAPAVAGRLDAVIIDVLAGTIQAPRFSACEPVWPICACSATSINTKLKFAPGKIVDFGTEKVNHDAPMKTILSALFTGIGVLALAMSLHADNQLSPKQEEAAEVAACAHSLAGGFLKVPDARDQRFRGKVTEPTARCRGGQKAVQFRPTPWVDWSNYWGTGDTSSLPVGFLSVQVPKLRGVTGALLDLEYQRIELIKFNLFDNSGTYQAYVMGRGGVGGLP